jgi:hypothetical protein
MLETAYADNADMITLTDFSGNSRHGTSPIGQRPKYRTNVQNGQAVVRFAGGGSDQNFKVTTLHPAWWVAPITMFTVFKKDTMDTDECLIGVLHALCNGSNSGGLLFSSNLTGWVVPTGGNAANFYTLWPETAGWQLCTAQFITGDNEAWRNKTSVGTRAGIPDMGGNYHFTVGISESLASKDYDGDLGVSFAYSRILTDAERETVMDAMIARFGI